MPKPGQLGSETRGSAKDSSVRKRGRPFRPDIVKIKVLLDQVALGQTHQDACHVAELPWTTFQRLRRQAEILEAEGYSSRDSFIVDFWHEVLRAEAYAKAHLVHSARKHALKDGRLALDMLKARYPEEWGKRLREVKVAGEIAVEHGGAAKLEVSLADMVDVEGLPEFLIDELMQVLARIDAWRSGADITANDDNVIVMAAPPEKSIEERNAEVAQQLVEREAEVKAAIPERDPMDDIDDLLAEYDDE